MLIQNILRVFNHKYVIFSKYLNINNVFNNFSFFNLILLYNY